MLHQVVVWEMGEMRTVSVLEGFHRRAVTTVKFSPDGRLLATMGADDHHGLAVYDWKNSVLLCTTRLEHTQIDIFIFLPFFPRFILPIELLVVLL